MPALGGLQLLGIKSERTALWPAGPVVSFSGTILWNFWDFRRIDRAHHFLE